MTNEKIIKAWKNEQYRHTLSAIEQAELPAHPAGMVELDETGLGNVSGGTANPICFVVSIFCLSLLFGTCGAGSVGCCTPVEEMI
jgi:mersacidin/lichenicidin family type 2 lantibiotic